MLLYSQKYYRRIIIAGNILTLGTVRFHRWPRDENHRVNLNFIILTEPTFSMIVAGHQLSASAFSYTSLVFRHGCFIFIIYYDDMPFGKRLYHSPVGVSRKTLLIRVFIGNERNNYLLNERMAPINAEISSSPLFAIDANYHSTGNKLFLFDKHYLGESLAIISFRP